MFSSVEIKKILRQLSDHNRLLIDKPVTQKETTTVCNELPNSDLPDFSASPPLQAIGKILLI